MNAVTEARSAAALRAVRPVHRTSVHSTARQATHSPSCDAAATGSTTMTLTLRGVVRGTTVRELPVGTAGPVGVAPVSIRRWRPFHLPAFPGATIK